VAAPRPGPTRRKITNSNWSISGLGVAHRDEREQPGDRGQPPVDRRGRVLIHPAAPHAHYVRPGRPGTVASRQARRNRSSTCVVTAVSDRSSTISQRQNASRS